MGVSSECDEIVAKAACRSSRPDPCCRTNIAIGVRACPEPASDGLKLPILRLPSLNSHGAAQRAFVHSFTRAGIDDGAAVHHGEVVAELERKVEILLDQHGCDLTEVAEISNGAADVLDDRRLDAFGGLIEQE